MICDKCMHTRINSHPSWDSKNAIRCSHPMVLAMTVEEPTIVGCKQAWREAMEDVLGLSIRGAFSGGEVREQASLMQL